MPLIAKRVVMTANGTTSALADDQFEYLPFDADVQIAVMADATGVLATIYSGSDLLQDEGPVPIGTINVAPKFPDDYHLQDVAAAGERIKVRLRDTTGAVRTVMVYVKLTPI